MTPQEVDSFVRTAIECSVYIAPLEPGLTRGELEEVGKRESLQAGEIGDALTRGGFQHFVGTDKFQPDDATMALWLIDDVQQHEYRNLDARDYVTSQFNQVIRSEGGKAAKLERRLIVERAVASGIGRHAIEVELTILILTEQLIDDGGVLASKWGVVSELPSVRRRNSGLGHTTRGPIMRGRVFPAVKDVVARRWDGRPKYAEPFDALAESLEPLGYGMFRLWWIQTASELRRLDTNTCYAAVSVLSAALVEGALTFVVKHAQSLGLGAFGSRDFEGAPKTWRIDALVNGATRGGESAILSRHLSDRVNRLIHIRQRIHAGRMLSEYPGGPPDLRPDEAREAKMTAEQVVRAVLDWLQKHPPAGRANST